MSDALPHSPAPQALVTTRGSKAVLVLMGLILACAGGVFIAVLWHSGQRALETRQWTPAPCTILFSSVDPDKWSANDPLKWRLRVSYRYVWEGKEMTGSSVRRVEGPTPHKERAEAVAARYPAGTQTECFVNPARPDQAILEHETKAAFYTLWWPLLFVVGGLGMIVAAFRQHQPGARSGTASVML